MIESYHLADDGRFPNNDRLALLLYRGVLTAAPGSPAAVAAAADPGSVCQERFAAVNWTNGWRNGIYPFHHYHSTSHEVLGITAGVGTVRLGGERLGVNLTVRAGDVLLIPAGVAHCNLGASTDFAVVGAYPDGRRWDLNYGKPGERPHTDENIARLPLPATDPVYGADGPLIRAWHRGERVS